MYTIMHFTLCWTGTVGVSMWTTSRRSALHFTVHPLNDSNNLKIKNDPYIYIFEMIWMESIDGTPPLTFELCENVKLQRQQLIVVGTTVTTTYSIVIQFNSPIDSWICTRWLFFLCRWWWHFLMKWVRVNVYDRKWSVTFFVWCVLVQVVYTSDNTEWQWNTKRHCCLYGLNPSIDWSFFLSCCCPVNLVALMYCAILT